MIRGRFARRPDGGLDVELHQDEAGLVRNVLTALRQVVAGEGEDPAVARLYPPAFDDEEEAGDWAFLTRDTLARERSERIDRVLATLDAGKESRARWEGRLDADDASAWLGAVNDARLVLGVRIGVTEEMYERPPPPGDERRSAFDVYTYFGWLESELLEALEPGLHGDIEPRGER